MITIFTSLLVFVGVTVTHVLLHRWLVKKGIKTFKSVLIYGLGLTILLFIFGWQPISDFYRSNDFIPITGIFIYLLVSTLYVMLFTTPYTGDVTPSTTLLSLIKHSPGLTLSTIIKHFSDHELIENRLKNLTQQGYIQKYDHTYKILPKGKKLISIIDSYRQLLNWKSSG